MENEIVRATDSSVIPGLAYRVANAANIAAIDRLVDATRYPYVVAWGKWLGFTPQAVQKNVLQAQEDNAPPESIQKIDGQWRVLDDIQNDENRRRVVQFARSAHGRAR
ncbi:hypothetical protein [Planctomyces sp. SH-PL14]|uniref:hypothetical protein n=1 Tax=Planctomyces sp. SH-PL14 TaxID=1632864 RepID=UPI00078E3BD9|nr:hypothetical protein [Planctomyces sp. SH-PL14]AMV17412.1 hypothetical protein VT03_05940 [Planctomyces sp. SH-PL14]